MSAVAKGCAIEQWGWEAVAAQMQRRDPSP